MECLHARLDLSQALLVVVKLERHQLAALLFQLWRAQMPTDGGDGDGDNDDDDDDDDDDEDDDDNDDDDADRR